MFWKKWHISLTSWFRDYVYIPLGGNKTNKIKHLFNILVVFALSGLWHGAGFNFILWGTVHAIGYMITLAVINQLKIKLPSAISYVFNFVLVAFIFVFFRSGQLSESLAIFTNLCPKQENLNFIPISYFLLANLFFLFLLEYKARTHNNYKTFIEQNNYFKNLLIYIYIAFAILTFSGIDNLPFIYFQF